MSSYSISISRIVSWSKIALFAVIALIVSLVLTQFILIAVDVADIKALYAVPAAFLALAIGVFGLARRNPVLFFVVCLIVLMPIAGINIPPGRFDISIFKAMAFFATLGMLFHASQYAKDMDARNSLFVLLATFSLIPTLLQSAAPWHSAFTLLGICCLYPVIFGLITYIRQTPESFDRLNFWIAVSLILVAIAVVFEKLTGIAPLRANLNLNVLAESGIYRAGGFFQDPQKAAQYAASFGIYFYVLLLRGAIKDGLTIKLAWLAVLASVIVLLGAASRASFLALVVTVVGATAISLGRNISIKVIAITISVCIGVALVLFWKDFIDLLPSGLSYRLKNLDSGGEARWEIWVKSWRIFEKAPWFGIGPGGYQEYLMQERPTLRMFQQMGGYVPDQPESGYLKILYETGLFGVSIVLFILGRFALGIYRCISYGGLSRDVAMAVILTLGVFSISFSTLFTVSDPRNLLVLLIMGALVLAFESNPTAALQRKNSCH